MTILGRSEGLVSRCVECDLAEPESLASLGGSAPGVFDGILSELVPPRIWFESKPRRASNASPSCACLGPTRTPPSLR